MNAPKHIGNAMSEYRIAKQDLIGAIPEQQANYDKLSVVIICLNEETPEGNCAKLHGFLNTLLSPAMDAAEKERLLAENYGLVMEQELGKELRQMCNLSEAIEERGIKKGLKRGLKQGKAQGRAQGIQLAKAVIRLAGEGKNEEEISAACHITVNSVREILSD